MMLHCISSYWYVSSSTDRQLLASLLCRQSKNLAFNSSSYNSKYNFVHWLLELPIFVSTDKHISGQRILFPCCTCTPGLRLSLPRQLSNWQFIIKRFITLWMLTTGLPQKPQVLWLCPGYIKQVAGDTKMVKSIQVGKTGIQFLEDLDVSGSTCTTVVPAGGWACLWGVIVHIQTDKLLKGSGSRARTRQHI